jgi:hypothetical protein
MGGVKRRHWRTEIVVALSVLGAVALWSPAAASDLTDAGVFVLPFEIDADFGAANGDAIIGRFLPVNTVFISEGWKVVNMKKDWRAVLPFERG